MVPGSAQATATQEGQTAKAKIKQRPTKPPHIAPGVNGRGKTFLVGGRIRTNADQKAKVTVTARTAKGQLTTRRDFRVTRTGKGKVVVWSSGAKKLRIRLVISAPATKKYTPYKKVKNYRTTPPEKVGRVKGGGPAKDAFKLLDWLVEAVAGEVVSYVFGFSVGALFGSDNKGTDLTPILNQLNKIQEQLTQISSQIDELSKEVRQMNCEIQTTNLAASVATIEAYSDKFRRLIKSKNTDKGDLTTWATDATNPGQVLAALKTINKIMVGQAGAAGSIRACSASFIDAWNKPLDEATYYTRVWNYMGYFQMAQMLGANVLTEANHLLAMQAAQAAKKMPKPVDATKVCADGQQASGRVTFYCNEALAIINEVYWNMMDQTLQAGAGFAWNLKSWDRSMYSEPAMSIAKGTPLVWMRDYSRYSDITTWCGPGPFDSATRKCKLYMGTSSPRVNFSAGYTGWQAANSNQWGDLLNTAKTGDRRISEIMESAGFIKGRVDKMIVYTDSRQSSFDNPWVVWRGGRDNATKMPIAADKYNNAAFGQCLLDTNFVAAKNSARWPACADPGGVTLDTLLNKYSEAGDKRSYTWTTPDWVTKQGSDPDFYSGQLSGDITYKQDKFWQKPRITRAPGWLSYSGPWNAKDEYVWPVFDVSNPKQYQCTTLTMDKTHKYPLALKNAGGAYSMCSDDYVQWLKSWWPTPPRPPA